MSVHLNAEDGQIADTVLLPGDPLRARWIAETFFENPVCYNEVRGMLGYTGTYRGKRVSVQGTGMGAPSAMIYSTELISEYGVKRLIRVGSAGSYQLSVNLRDVVIAMSASTTSSFTRQQFGFETYAPTADGELFIEAVKVAKAQNIHVKTGNVLSADIFYDDNRDYYKKWAAYGVLCVDMETAAIYTVAAKHGAEAISLLTISDSLVTHKGISKEERESNLRQMVELALELVRDE